MWKKILKTKIMFIKYIIFIIIVLFLRQTITVEAYNEKILICYHGSWSFHRNSLRKFDITHALDPLLCTHLIYAFIGLDETGQLSSKDPNLDLSCNKCHENFRKFNALKLRNPQLKTLLSVGGSKSSRNYSITAADPVKRSKFLESALDYMERFGFDGLDLDWEYPNRYHTLNNNNDRENFISLLKEIKEGFEPHGYLLTAAVGSTEYTPHVSYNIKEMVKYLDYINVMAYDLHGPWESVVGHNAPLYAGPLDTTERAKQHSVDSLARYWINQGALRHKLVMGIPFYGRSFTLKDLAEPYIGALHIGRDYAGTLSYDELCEKFKMEKLIWHLKWDSIQMVPYAHNNRQWISYDNETSISLKIDYVQKENLAGIMIWTIELDDFRGVCGSKPYPLLTFINSRLLANNTKGY